MSDYIEREAVNDLIKAECSPKVAAYLIDAVAAIPAADVRPVVTCADCKYNTREVNDLLGNKAIQCITGLTHRRDWFCADGKKREES